MGKSQKWPKGKWSFSLLFPDGNGELSLRQMGMLVKKDNLGFGMRSWRLCHVTLEMGDDPRKCFSETWVHQTMHRRTQF